MSEPTPHPAPDPAVAQGASTDRKAAARRRGLIVLDADIITAVGKATNAAQLATGGLCAAFTGDVPSRSEVASALARWTTLSAQVAQHLANALEAHERRALLAEPLADALPAAQPPADAPPSAEPVAHTAPTSA